MKNFGPISPKFPYILHGGDYNPDQWIDSPEILEEDMRLAHLAGCNTFSVGIFSWSTLEPEEDVYNFQFLDEAMDRLQKNGFCAVLATPSGARPAWMSNAHPEVLRVNADRTKNIHGARHNHCYTSPYYRAKTQKINRLLAERYKNHPALGLWHVSNEYGGECHCPLCQQAFREWLKKKYNNDLDKLNYEYWTKFWSHTYTSWDQIESPSPLGDSLLHALNLDWKRFVSAQTMDFMQNEIIPIREIMPEIPVTTNFMGLYDGLDYFKFKDTVDVVSLDNYPAWHSPEGILITARNTAFTHDLMRSIKGGKPHMLMESTPSCVNWQQVNKLKRPEIHKLSELQALAHGSDAVMYFQWRKSRGGPEKFHGAVVDHCGHENTRVFRDVANLGATLKKLDDIIGTYVNSEVAIVYDWENRWAVEGLKGWKLDEKRYFETCEDHYDTFWKNGINVDMIDSDCDFSKYRLVIAPMFYMLKPGMIEKIQEYTARGGNIVCTYGTGQVNENDLCFLGGFPADGLKDVFGIWAEEMDCLYEEDDIRIRTLDGKEFAAKDYCEIIHAETAQVLAAYKSDFYAGTPAVTRNRSGKGNAYYIAFRDTGAFLNDFYNGLIEELNLEKAIPGKLPDGVTAHTREDEKSKFIFLENFNSYPVTVPLPHDEYTDMITGTNVSANLLLDAYGAVILKT